MWASGIYRQMFLELNEMLKIWCWRLFVLFCSFNRVRHLAASLIWMKHVEQWRVVQVLPGIRANVDYRAMRSKRNKSPFIVIRSACSCNLIPSSRCRLSGLSGMAGPAGAGGEAGRALHHPRERRQPLAGLRPGAHAALPCPPRGSSTRAGLWRRGRGGCRCPVPDGESQHPLTRDEQDSLRDEETKQVTLQSGRMVSDGSEGNNVTFTMSQHL